MTVGKSAAVKKLLAGLLKVRDGNVAASELYNVLLEDDYGRIASCKVQDAMETGASPEEAVFLQWLNMAGVTSAAVRPLIKTGHLVLPRQLNPRDYLFNPFMSRVKPKAFTQDGYSLETNYYEAFEPFLFDSTRAFAKDLYVEHNNMGFFSSSFPYLELVKDNVVWMSITPYEINTMKTPLAHATGKVLTFGLGLGYFAFMAAQKTEVISVDVVENDPRIIGIFEKYLRPLFPMGSKIRIVPTDALAFASQKDSLAGYDFCFADLWHGAEDGLELYAKLCKAAAEAGQKHFDYWIEDSILCHSRRLALALLEEQNRGLGPENYAEAHNAEDRAINGFYDLTVPVNLTHCRDILSFIADDGLRGLIFGSKN